MILFSIVQFLKSYLELEITGNFIEKFLNICMHRKIYLWDVSIKGNKMKAKIKPSSFKKIRPVAKIARVRPKIIRKCGLRFILRKNKDRYALIWGIMAMFIAILVLSSFIWRIDIIGNEKVSSLKIIEVLKENGIKRGSYKRINTEALETVLLRNVEDMSWCFVEIKGVRLIVNIKEKNIAPKILPKDVPCNIIAVKDGIISDMVVKQGKPVLRPGDTVLKGDLIITGVMDSEVAETRYVHAYGDVKARTWYENSKVVSKTQTSKVFTEKYKYGFNLFGFKLVPKNNYELYETEEINLIGKLDLYKYSEYVENSVSYSEEELIAKTLEELRTNIKFPVLNESHDVVFIDDKTMMIKLITECEEEIGESVEIKLEG